MADLPDATVTFLCTDVECSTELVKRLQEGYAAVLATHYELLGRECARRGGITLGTEGDALFIVFGRAREAVEAAVASQRALAAHTWPGGADVSVRMGLHTGEPYRNDDEYTGVAVIAPRVCAPSPTAVRCSSPARLPRSSMTTRWMELLCAIWASTD
jgi:class 3 adenylate cyclase